MKSPNDDENNHHDFIQKVTCPQYIINYLKSILSSCTTSQTNLTANDDQPNEHRPKGIVDITFEKEFYSAQHVVFIIHLVYSNPTVDTVINQPNNNNILDRIPNGRIPLHWQNAIENGNNRIVIRIWNGSKRWWNLNYTTDNSKTQSAIHELANDEIWGYQTARTIFQQQLPTKQQNESDDIGVRIPEILYFSLWDDHSNNLGIRNPSYLQQNNCDRNSRSLPWAILEYVGQDSMMFTSRENTDNYKICSTNNNTLLFDDTYVRTMIKLRDEFGFNNEPHLRWGRVPVSDCLQYAERVLLSVIIPIHNYFISNQRNPEEQKQHDLDWKRYRPITYLAMLELYKQTFHNELVKYRTTYCNQIDDRLLSKMIDTLGLSIDQLEREALLLSSILSCQAPVLCHMDYQPQNLIFAKKPESSESFIVSVLDWEEAAYADPRLDILLVCRKVCANRQQADYIWNLYHQTILRHQIDTDSKRDASIISLDCENPIEPWLKLETVHSITTLLLERQELNDNKSNVSSDKQAELDGKIQREFQRLVWIGWDFCNLHV